MWIGDGAVHMPSRPHGISCEGLSNEQAEMWWGIGIPGAFACSDGSAPMGRTTLDPPLVPINTGLPKGRMLGIQNDWSG